MRAHTQHFTVRELKAPSNVSNWPQTWKFSLFLLHMTIFKNSAFQIFRPTILQLMSKLCSLCLILDGPLEKWLGEGEGRGDFVSLQDFFYMSTTLAKSFFWGGDQGHCTMFFWGGGQDGYSTVTILIFNYHNMIAWNRLETNTVFLSST